MGHDLLVAQMLIVEVFTTITILVTLAGKLAAALEKTTRAFQRLKTLYQA